MRTWQNGKVATLTDWGHNPSLNNLGDMLFLRWYDQNRSWDTWLYRVSDGEPTFYRLTDEDPWNGDGDINDSGEVARKCRLPSQTPRMSGIQSSAVRSSTSWLTRPPIQATPLP